MNKKILVIFLLFTMILSLLCLSACGGNDIVLAGTQHGSISASHTSAREGQQVTITLTPDQGYRADEVLINGQEHPIQNNQAVFSMPNQPVNVEATFVTDNYALNVQSSVGGSIVANDRYASGEQVTLKVVPAFGYYVQGLVVDGAPVSLNGDKYQFTMPARDVDVSASFAMSAVQPTAIPGGEVASISANAPAGGMATSKWYLAFEEQKIVVTAYVTDGTILSSKDGIMLYSGRNNFADRIGADNHSIKVSPDGTVTVKNGYNGNFVSADNGGVSADVKVLSLQGNKVDGYIISVELPYEFLGVTKANAQSNLTLLPYLLNGDREGTAFGATESTLDEFYSHVNPNTYPLVSTQGFRQNSYMFGQGELGSYKDILAQGGQWDTSRDYPQGHENYADRKVTLNGHDGGDNNIAFVRSAGTTSFVKATFKVTALHNEYERFPKFGFMVYDTQLANSGVFMYVDAYAAEGKTSGIQLIDLVGTSLGYASQLQGGWLNWTTLSGTEGMFNNNTKTITLSICYNNGFVYFFVEVGGQDVLIGVTTYKAQGDVVISIKSFALGLEVTNYFATNDPSDESFKTHNKRADGTTIGDNASGYAYTEGWSFFGDLAENTGAGDQIVYIKGVTASTNFYAQADLTSPTKVGNMADQYTKAGAVLKNENYTIMGYVDLNDHTAANNRVVCNFAVRFESGERLGQWIWEAGVSSSFGITIEDKFVTIGIAKLGPRVYLTMNGIIVATYYNKDIEDQAFVAGMMGFNRSMMVKNGSGTMDIDQVKQKIGLTTAENVVFDGVLDDAIWTEQVLGATQTFADQGDGRKVQIAAVKGQDGVFVALTLYTNTMQRQFAQSVGWSEACNIEFRLHQMSDSNKTNRNLVHYVAFYDFLDGDVTTSASFLNAQSKLEQVTFENGQKGYKVTVEFFIPYNYFGNNASADKLPIYVWTATFDDNNMPAMNRTYNQQIMYVTDNGLVVENI